MESRERDAGKNVDRDASGPTMVFWGAVILGVCVILCGFFYPYLAGRPEIERHPEAPVTVRNIRMALQSYYNDYGHFPEIVKPLPNGKKMICVGDPASKISDGPNSLLLDVLRDIPRGPNANHALNPKQQKYFEGRVAREPKTPRSGFADGTTFSAADQGCLFDPWGHQYCIVFSMDGSETLDLSAVYSDLAGPEHLIRSPVAAFSLGKDGIPGGKGYEGKFRKPSSSDAPDDIVSWQ